MANDAKQMMTVDEAAEKLRSLSFWTEDVEVGDVKVETVQDPENDKVDVFLGHGERNLPVADASGVASCLGLSGTAVREYIDNAPLLKSMISHSLKKRSDETVRLMGTQDAILSVRKPEGPNLTPPQAFEMARQTLNPLHVERITTLGTQVEVRLVTDYAEHPPSDVNDLSHAGVMFSMNGAVKVAGFSVRLICTNGQSRVFEKHSYGDIEDPVEDSMRDIFEAAHADAVSLTRNFVKLAETPLEAPEQITVRLGRRAGLPARFVTEATEAMPSLPPDASQYDLMNLLTRMARDVRNNTSLIQSLGELTNALAKANRSCSHCGTVLG